MEKIANTQDLMQLNSRHKKRKGFTLIEVVAAAALIGIMSAMLIPAISGTSNKIRDTRLQSDLATIDQAIMLHKLEKGSLPANISALGEYIAGSADEYKDAKGDALVYEHSDDTYTLKGKNSQGQDVLSTGSTVNTTGGS